MELPFSGSIIPGVISISVKVGRTPQLVLSDIGAETVQTCVVIELAPGQRVFFAAEAEKSIERNHRICHPTAHFIDHEPPHRAHVVSASIVNGGAFDAIAFDQRFSGHHARGIARSCSHGLSPYELEERNSSGTVPHSNSVLAAPRPRFGTNRFRND